MCLFCLGFLQLERLTGIITPPRLSEAFTLFPTHCSGFLWLYNTREAAIAGHPLSPKHFLFSFCPHTNIYLLSMLKKKKFYFHKLYASPGTGVFICYPLVSVYLLLPCYSVIQFKLHFLYGYMYVFWEFLQQCFYMTFARLYMVVILPWISFLPPWGVNGAARGGNGRRRGSRNWDWSVKSKKSVFSIK